jgi:hypothetical protein
MSSPSPEDGNRSISQNDVVSSVLECWTLDKVNKNSNSDVEIYYCWYLYLLLSAGNFSDRSIINKQTPWSESASELYRPSDRRFSAK